MDSVVHVLQTLLVPVSLTICSRVESSLVGTLTKDSVRVRCDPYVKKNVVTSIGDF